MPTLRAAHKIHPNALTLSRGLMDRPFVLCGLGRMGSRVLDHLHKAGFAIVVIDTVCKPDDPRLAGVGQ